MLCNFLIESFPKNIEFLVNVDVDLEEGVTVVQIAVQVIAIEKPVIEDSLLEKDRQNFGGEGSWRRREVGSQNQ
jgi:hypothetical protein